MVKHRNIVAKTYKKFTKISRDLTGSYTEAYGLPCDLYFPIRTPKKAKSSYQKVNLFEPHELPVYRPEPNVKDYYFYIPELMKEESMNSVAQQFDTFALATKGMLDQPFIECNPDDELPDYTKVVVKIEGSTMSYFVDIKHVVNGAGGHMLMRQYLSPLTKDNQIIEGKYDDTIPGSQGSTNGINDRLDGKKGGYLD
nr:MAG TPA: hypothetical protein [Caudoviricetes sp.]